jgi:hypothetical protein
MEEEEAGGISFLMRKVIFWLIWFAMILALGSLFFILFNGKQIEDTNVDGTYEAKSYFYVNIDDLNNLSAPVYEQLNGTFVKVGIVNDFLLKGGNMKWEKL